MAHVIQAVSIESQLLFDRLASTKVGDVLTFLELSAIADRDIRTQRSPLYSAMRRALNEHGFVFGSVSGVGVKRLSDIEVVDCSQSDIAKVRRLSGRAYRKLTQGVSNFDALPNDRKILHNMNASIWGALSQITKGPNIKKLEQRVTEAASVLPLQKTLDAFRA